MLCLATLTSSNTSHCFLLVPLASASVQGTRIDFLGLFIGKELLLLFLVMYLWLAAVKKIYIFK